MDTILEPARQIPVIEEVDICVIGGSCTGVFAAVCAARLGARVAIVEEQGFFGGVATAGLVNVWHSIYDTLGQQQIIAGLTTEVIERLRQRRAATLQDPTNASVYCSFNPAELILSLDRLVVEAGVRPFLHTHFAAPLFQDDRLVAIAVEDKSGRRAIAASYFVDATGDGDLVARMGLACYTRDGLQPPTTCAILRGLGAIVDKHPSFSLSTVAFDPQYETALEQGFLWSAHVPGSRDETMVAGTRVSGADCSSADQLTRAEMQGRLQVSDLCDILREHYMEGDVAPLVALPAKIGIRETRHVRCLHTLTEHEVLRGVRFPDAIANGTYRVDVHHHDRPGLTFRYLDGKQEYVLPDGTRSVGRWCPEGEATATFYQIPYRSLLPIESKNVIAAGRVLDADRGAFGAARVMVNCNQTGEAAGTAAYLALDGSVDVAQVGASELRDTMRKSGAIVI